MKKILKPTHVCDLIGCDNRASDFRKPIFLVEKKNYYHLLVDNKIKYRKETGHRIGGGNWPMYKLDLNSLRPFDITKE